MNYSMIGGDGKEYGPVTGEQLRAWFREGRVTAATQIKGEGAADWQRLTAVPEFADLAPAPGAPPAVPGMQPRRAGDAPAPAAKSAVWSMILGIAGILCMGPFAGIPAVICGHSAKRKIRESGGSLGGDGMATAGLVMGYLSLVSIFFIAILAGMLLPAMGAARERARQINCSTNLKQMGIAIKMYSSDYQGALPPDFVALAQNKYLDAYKVYTCPSTPHVAAESSESFAAEQYQSYVYFGAGLKESDTTRETIIVADRSGNHRKAFNVLCGDGHVETLTGGNSLEELARRRGLKLPAGASAP